MRHIYAATALIALTIAWLTLSGIRAYQSTCDRARAMLRQNGGQLSEALKADDIAEIRKALRHTRFDTISSISFWGVDMLDQRATSAITVGDGQDPVVCELPLGELGSVAFQMRPIQFLQSVVANQIVTIIGLWLIALLAFLIPYGEPKSAPSRQRGPIECDAFSSLNQVLESKRAVVGRKVQLLLLRPTGSQNIQLSQRDFQLRISHMIDRSVQFGANSVCFTAKVQGQELHIKMTDNHAQETLLSLPI